MSSINMKIMKIQNLKSTLQEVTHDSKIQNSQEGVSVYLALIIMLVLLAIALGMSTITVSQMKMIRGMEYSVIALYAADTGVETVLYQDKLCRLPGCEGLPWPCLQTGGCNGRSSVDSPISGDISSASYQVNFNDGAFTITSGGTYKETKRAIEATRPAPP